MRVSVSDLIKQVRVAMDENTNESQFEFDATNLDLNEIIKSKLVEAVRKVHESADTMLVEGKQITSEAVKNQDGSGYVPLPSDFMRLVIFRMSGWKRPVVDPISDASADYALQKNKYVRGNVDKPVCAISTDGAGNKILEYYSLPASTETHVITHATYVPYPEIIDENISVSARLVGAVVYAAAGLTYITLNDTARAESFFKIATEFIDGNIING